MLTADITTDEDRTYQGAFFNLQFSKGSIVLGLVVFPRDDRGKLVSRWYQQLLKIESFPCVIVAVIDSKDSAPAHVQQRRLLKGYRIDCFL